MATEWERGGPAAGGGSDNPLLTAAAPQRGMRGMGKWAAICGFKLGTPSLVVWLGDVADYLNIHTSSDFEDFNIPAPLFSYFFSLFVCCALSKLSWPNTACCCH
jgi:hypothetical protein